MERRGGLRAAARAGAPPTAPPQAARVLGAALWLLLQAAPSAAQSGVLLGFASRDSSSVLWVSETGGGIRALRLPVLVVPRPEGFWRAGVAYGFLSDSGQVSDVTGDTVTMPRPAEVGRWLAVGLWAAPLARQPVLPPIDTALLRGGGLGRALSFTFLGADYLAIEDHIVVPGRTNRSLRMIGWLDTLAARGYAEPGAPVAGDLGHTPPDPRLTPELLRNHVSWCVQHAAGAPPADSAGEPIGQDSWGLVRAPGHWRYVRRFSQAAWAAGGWFYDCPVALPPPKAITGADELHPGWAWIARQVTGARDAFTSPDGRLLVVLTPSGVRVSHPSGEQVGRALFRVRAPELPVVLVRWAEGDTVSAWTQQLEALGAQAVAAAPPEPPRRPTHRPRRRVHRR